MRATAFEFRFRAALIGLLYYIGFAVYGYDHTPVVQAMANWILGPHSSHGILLERILIESGALLVAFGALARTWGAAYLRANVVHDAQLHAAELVADGPYRYVRHPLYFGSIVANVGLAFVASRLGFVIIRGHADAALCEAHGARGSAACGTAGRASSRVLRESAAPMARAEGSCASYGREASMGPSSFGRGVHVGIRTSHRRFRHHAQPLRPVESVRSGSADLLGTADCP